jgi:hypothetical protein
MPKGYETKANTINNWKVGIEYSKLGDSLPPSEGTTETIIPTVEAKAVPLFLLGCDNRFSFTAVVIIILPHHITASYSSSSNTVVRGL